MFKAFRTLRARVLAIALVPSVALLVIGGGGAAYLVVQGQQLNDWADEMRTHASPGLAFVQTVQQERRMSMMRIAGHPELSANLRDVRPKVDTLLRQIIDAAAAFENQDAGLAAGAQTALDGLSRELSSVRAKVDTNTISVDDSYTFYNQLTDTARAAMASFAHGAPDSEIAIGFGTVLDLFTAAESMARAHDLAVAAEATGGLSPAEVEEFGRQVGFYRNQMQLLPASLTDEGRAQWKALSESPAWRTLSEVETVLVRRGDSTQTDQDAVPSSRSGTRGEPVRTDDSALPVSTADWEAAIAVVSKALLELWTGQAERITEFIQELGDSRARNSLLGGLVVLLVTAATLATTLQLSGRMIRRLHRLRAETTALTDDKLPAIVGALNRGEPVDIEKELTRLDFGTDEIGQVADAFNRAQLAAVNAAATEARTREGVNSVFVNIAHRSQVVLHRHIKLLNDAEYDQEDPKILDLLFRLHHLATRERRNAENLIILGGEQPRRQWRNPVQLDELVRGAVAEAQDYFRVRVGRLPDVKVSGGVIADLIHLLAELIDNATSFSPPDSRVEVSGNAVGRGVVIEVVDQGIGMPAEQLAALNETLSNPPDFALAALSTDNRLGMFVVARLAGHIGVTARLAESEYGGVKAVVLIPASLLVSEDGGEPAWSISEPLVRTGSTPAMPPSAPDTFSGAGHSVAPSQDRPWRQAALPQEPSRGLIDRQGLGRGTAAGVDPLEHRGDPRPELPRRQRQSHLAPQLANSTPGPDAAAGQPPQRSAEEARDLFSAIERGTRQGRATPPPSFPTTNSE
ncbi:sensor histidine kinase [Nocardia barduliensis]|uniref:sensor histidine kinase n=1 Tax=Nocardia barduliensis TaxID=2736643 RepID=UPI001572B6B2|nr:nitrate- and nitrite sensing domain-containing protein [Nocardia barduliensis]